MTAFHTDLLTALRSDNTMTDTLPQDDIVTRLEGREGLTWVDDAALEREAAAADYDKKRREVDALVADGARR